MKKLSTLLLTLVMLLMVMMHVVPNAQAAEGEQAKLTYTIVNKTNQNGTNSETIEVTLGNEVRISLEGNEQFGYYIHAGVMITDASQTFIASASNHVVVVMKKSPSDTVATFVDTNGEFLGAIYNPTLDSESLDISVSKPGFDFVGFDALEASVDKVYVAKYSRANQEEINVNITGGSKDLEVVQYNDVVTLTPNAGNFSYWEDKDGQVVSRQANYTFTALQNVELTAVFDDPAPSEPVVYLSNVTGISPHTKSFLGYVEDDFIEYGLLASDKEEVLTLETEDVTVIPSKALHPETNEFLRSIPNDTNLKSFRAYAKLAGGEVFYSDNNFVKTMVASGNRYTETFDDSTAGTSYGDGNFSGVNGVVWSFVHARNEYEFAINGSGVLLRRSNEPSSLSVTIPQGISEFSFEYRKAYTGDTERTYSVDIISSESTTTYNIPGFGSGSGEDNTVHTFNYEGEAIHEEVEIKIYATGSDGNQQATFDNFKWTEASELVESWIKYYTVVIDDGKDLYEQHIKQGDNLGTLSSPTKEGHTFIGWEDENNNPFNFSKPITKQTLITAKFVVNQYTLSFDSNGGSSVEPITQDFGTEVTAPSEPTREGYTFTGWNTELPLTIPSSNQEFVAQWTINSYMITFDVNGGTPIDSMDVEYNEALTIEAATHPTLFFSGWYEDSDFTIPFERLLMPANDLTLYAKWVEQAPEVTVTFDSNGGSEVASIIVELGSPIDEPTSPTKDGFIFVGWYSDVDLQISHKFTSNILMDITLYAKWQSIINTVVATYPSGSETKYMSSGNNASLLGLNQEIFTVTSTQRVNSPLHVGLHSSGQIRLYGSSDTNGNILQFAVSPEYIILDVEFNFSGTVAPAMIMMDEVEVHNGFVSGNSTLSFNDLNISEFSIKNIVPNTNRIDINSIQITYGIISAMDFYEVKLYEGSILMDEFSVLSGSKIGSEHSITKEGYEFIGWYFDEELTSQWDAETPITENLVLYAKMEKLEEFTVSFETNGGTYIDEVMVYEGSILEVPTPPTKDDFSFSGWYTDPALTVLWDFDTLIMQDMTLYAKWIEVSEVEPAKISLTWSNVSNSDNTSYSNRTWTINELVFTADNLTRNGSNVEHTIQGNSSYSSRINSPGLGLIQEIAIRVPNTGVSAAESAKWYIEVAGNSEFSNSTKYGFGSGYSNTPNVDFSGHSASVTSTNVLTTKDTSMDTPSFVLDVSGDNARFVRFVWENGATYIAQIDITYIPQS